MSKSKHSLSIRVDETVGRELALIQKSLKLNLSDAIKTAIHSKYLEIQEQKQKETPREILVSMGFIGSFVAPSEASTDYKKTNLQWIKKKNAK